MYLKKFFVTNKAPTINKLANQFSSITINLKAEKALIRHDTLEGRDNLVVPCVMMTTGVHNGSMGALYYPEEELAKTPEVWDSKPIVVYHPKINGQSISACDPIVFDKQKIGVLMHTRFEDGKLKTECWIEKDKANEVDDRVLNALEEGSMMEVSTGLFTDHDLTEGVWNDEKYIGIARNYRPDHLAILPDIKGACSIEDGAGLLRNAAEQSNEPKALLAKSLTILFNELSHSDIWAKLNELIRPGINSDIWVNEVFETYFIYEENAITYHQKYLVFDNEVRLEGEKQEAHRI